MFNSPQCFNIYHYTGDATGPCYTYESNGMCSFPLSSHITQELCCATAGKGWGENCQPCADFEFKCDVGFLLNEEGKCAGELMSWEISDVNLGRLNFFSK